MRRVPVNWAALAAGVAFAAGCASAPSGTRPGEKQADVPATAAAQPAGEGMVLELEAFQLKQAQVKDLQGAGGGKAVLFDYLTGSARLSVPLKKGRYEVTVYAFAADPDEDAFYLVAADVNERLFPEEQNQISAARKVTMTVAKDGPVQFEVTPAEVNVMVDRLVIRPLPPAAR